MFSTIFQRSLAKVVTKHYQCRLRVHNSKPCGQCPAAQAINRACGTRILPTLSLLPKCSQEKIYDPLFTQETIHSYWRYFADGLQALSLHDGKQYYVPLAYGWAAIYYNKAIFAQYNLTPPQTWDEFTLLASAEAQTTLAKHLAGSSVTLAPTRTDIAATVLTPALRKALALVQESDDLVPTFWTVGEFSLIEVLDQEYRQFLNEPHDAETFILRLEEARQQAMQE